MYRSRSTCPLHLLHKLRSPSRPSRLIWLALSLLSVGFCPSASLLFTFLCVTPRQPLFSSLMSSLSFLSCDLVVVVSGFVPCLRCSSYLFAVSTSSFYAHRLPALCLFTFSSPSLLCILPSIALFRLLFTLFSPLHPLHLCSS